MEIPDKLFSISEIAVQGRLLPPRAVHVGVDMGRSFSVFLFCLAMDPIYHYLNRIPRIMGVQGCIDDNTIAGPSLEVSKAPDPHHHRTM